ncbi:MULTISPECIES: spore germination protein [unclassified Thermoactinomyces]|jgi:hypothetical protein|uniref:spore germination protein n=1 Tax=unclassified Thermoactinomyces TaxID=2634588 RepID=UPI0018DCEB6A|nr:MULTISPECIES: spore germination protein [unclassified Thermoactinomyces]MBH8597636.1 spore germination protein [Thermoactinomyces sp. CICC 10523]MBH8603977.1 spore germination protein [Thermoactinomyces sp. CICC 10522]MBH8606489.1 spore germination protein [Thermoactinomyces sp. CICC 10521]
MIQPIIVGPFKVNNVSATAKVNLSYGLNFLAYHHSFNKSNSVNSHTGDAPIQVVNAPICDQDLIDTPIAEVKLI